MNCHRSESHGMIPAELMLGRKLLLPFQVENMMIPEQGGNKINTKRKISYVFVFSSSS